MLLRECRDAKVHILTGCSVSTIARERNFDIETTAGPFRCEKLVIATGGLSFPKVGATDFGYLAAKQFGLKIVPTRPSLVPLVADDELDHSTLAGISLEAEVSAGRYSFRENILFTHRGFSGPAILQISNYWDRKIPVVIDLFPGRNARAILESGRLGSQQLANFLSGYLPAKFAAMFPGEETARRRMNQFADRELDEIAKRLNNWQVRFRETEGYAKAEVTAGGVSTDELSSATMEAKRVPGLYFVGEVVDVTGWLGGYNFQWAWSSGYAAGRVL
jgi:predicted Rossmann fold flavoprotein